VSDLLQPHSILDPIHGLVRFTDAEFAVLNHSLFQRLRTIKQNGLLLLVFPSATHNRMEHSIGVMRVADSMFQSVLLNSVVAAKKGAVVAPAENRNDVAIDFSAVDPLLRARIHRVVRLAALVHDLGHGPLSHAFDSFAPNRDDLFQLLDANAVPSLRPIGSMLRDWMRGGVPGSRKYDLVVHEAMSVVFFARIWQELGYEAVNEGGNFPNERMPLLVAAAILGDAGLAVAGGTDQEQAWLPFIHDMIASAPADADRMDYLERDSRACGVTYGLFDRNRVLKSFLCYRSASGKDIVYRLGIKQSGVPALENLVQARYQMYVQIYFHKTNSAISRMLKEIGSLTKAAHVGLFPVTPKDPLGTFGDWMLRYCDLSDEQFLRILRGDVLIGYDLPDEVIALGRAIHERVLWKRIWEGRKELADKVGDQLRAEEKDAEVAAGLILDPRDPGATKDLDKGAIILERGEDEIYAPVKGEAWYARSLIIPALSQSEASLGRVYARDAALDHVGRLKRRARSIALSLQVVKAE